MFRGPIFGIIITLFLGVMAQAANEIEISKSGVVKVGQLTFSSARQDLPWCRRDADFVYQGPRELVDEGRRTKLNPQFAIFGKLVKQKCPELRSIAYVKVSTIGQPSFCCHGIRDNDFVPLNWKELRAAMPDEPVFECDRFAAYPGDITTPKGVAGVLEKDMDAQSAVAACQKDMEENPEVARFPFQLGRALLMANRHDEAFKSFQRAEELGHNQALAYSGHAYANGWGVREDLGKANMAWRISRRLGANTIDSRNVELAVAAAAGKKARYICHYRLSDQECKEKEYWAQFTSGISGAQHKKIEKLFSDISPDMREIFIRLYAADYMGLEELKHSQVSAASNPNTAFGLVSNLFTGMKKLVNERTKASRYEPIVAQYALIKTNTFGLCAENSVQFAVDHKTVETWRNGYGVVVSQKTSDNGRTYFEVPKRFARTISDAKTTSEWSQYAAGIGRMIKRHGGCQSGVLKTLEDNMLRYQSWVPKT